MNIDELKTHLRDVFQAAFLFRMEGETWSAAASEPITDERRLNANAANILSDIAEAFLTKVNSLAAPDQIFVDRRFDKPLAAVGERIAWTGGEPWAPQSATEFLRVVTAHMVVAEA